MDLKKTVWKIIQLPAVRIVVGLVMISLALALKEAAQIVLMGAQVDADNKYPGPVSTLVSILAVFLAYWLFVRVVERRKLTEFARGYAFKELSAGIGIGAGLFVSLMAVLWALGFVTISGMNHWHVMIPVFGMALVSGFVEEVIIRGVIFRIMEEGLGTWIALIVSAALFGALHLGNDNATLMGAVSIALTAGVLLAAVYVYTRRLWLAIGLHFAWNFTQGGIFGVAVSGNEAKGFLKTKIEGPEFLTGGAFGPEASIFAIILCFSCGTYFLIKAYKEGKFMTPFWRAKPE